MTSTTIKLSDALNDSRNITKTIKSSAEIPIEYTDTVWDDLKFPFTQTKQGANLRPDFDYVNIGLLFPQNNDDEIVYMVAQFPHSRKTGSTIRPHVHYRQNAATGVVWKMDYKYFANGQPIPSTWTTLSNAGENAFDYVSGDLAQIGVFPEIAAPTGDNVSSIMIIRFYRDDNTTTGDVLAFEFDIHYQIDEPGSQEEYVK